MILSHFDVPIFSLITSFDEFVHRFPYWWGQPDPRNAALLAVISSEKSDSGHSNEGSMPDNFKVALYAWNTIHSKCLLT